MTKQRISKAAPKAQPTAAPKLASITPETAVQVAQGLANAAKSHKSAEVSLIVKACTAVRLIGQPLTAKQWDAQVSKDLKARLKKAVGETSVSRYASAFKTVGLAVLSGVADLQPIAGETLNAFCGRVREPLESATLKDGRAIYETNAQTGKVSKRGRKPGQKRTGTAAAASDSEGGQNASPMLAAARILFPGSETMARRMVVIATSYREEALKWAEGLVPSVEGVGDDKAALAAAMSSQVTANARKAA